jgi:hypothetical protein
MQDQNSVFANITQGMTVEDADGDKVGTVDATFLPAQVAAASAPAGTTDGEAHMKVSTGLFGLGSTLYVPASYIRGAKDDRVILTVDKGTTSELGWDQKPAWIDD